MLLMQGYISKVKLDNPLFCFKLFLHVYDSRLLSFLSWTKWRVWRRRWSTSMCLRQIFWKR